MSYTPYRLEHPALDHIRSPRYRAFLDGNVLAAGVKLLVQRRRLMPDYPFPNFKFNPNTGEDYPASHYETVFTWFLGRGSEACVRHLEVLDGLEELHDIRDEARKILEGYVQSQNDAILGILDRNRGRVPFRVNRRLEGVDAEGRRVSLPEERCNASEFFCAKALLASGRAEEEEVGLKLLQRFLDSAFRNGYEDDTAVYDREIHAEGPFMLSLGAIDYLIRAKSLAGRHAEWESLTARLLSYVLDNFWEPSDAGCEGTARGAAERLGQRNARGRFFELVRFDTKEKQPFFVPGHACELVGLGLQAIDALERSRVRGVGEAGGSAASETGRDDRRLRTGNGGRDGAGRPTLFERAKRELPRILAMAFDGAYDRAHGGMYQSLDPVTGGVISSDLPWWCMPETMRAAARCAAVASGPEERRPFLEIFATVSNDYLGRFLNPRMGLFPFRTRDGETGGVKNFMPVVPEADPLYHTNLAVIDLLQVIERFPEEASSVAQSGA